MPGNEENDMTKRIKSRALVKARKETKRLQREARTRIRKAKKHAIETNDELELKKVEGLEKRFSNSLTSSGKSGLPKTYTHNVKWEQGRALDLKNLVNKGVLNNKKRKRQTRRTFEHLFGKEKTKAIAQKMGGREMSRMSNQFWDEMYKAQDKLYAAGIVPADEIMGKYGSIGSGLLKTGKIIVNDGYWSGRKVEISSNISDDGDTPPMLKVVTSENDNQVETSDLSEAIVNWYKEKYGLM